MAESIYLTFDGPKGKAEVMQISPEDKPWEVQWEVSFKEERHPCSAEGEATIVAAELSGTTEGA